MAKVRLLAPWVEHERRSAMYHDTSAVSVEGCREGAVCEVYEIVRGILWCSST